MSYIIQEFNLQVARDMMDGSVIPVKSVYGKMSETLENGKPRYKIGEYVDVYENGNRLDYYEFADAKTTVKILEQNDPQSFHRIIEYKVWN